MFDKSRTLGFGRIVSLTRCTVGGSIIFSVSLGGSGVRGGALGYIWSGVRAAK